jgi:DNA-binding NtrC family response regulator
MLGTLSEVESRQSTHRACALFVVLSYDDLLAEPQAVFVIPKGVSLTVGRGPAGMGSASLQKDSLQLPDPFASGRHAVIEPCDGGHRLRDQESRNGCYVNGERVTEHVLTNGDLVEVGHTLLCYREASGDTLAELARRPARLGPTRTLCPAMAELAAQMARIAATRDPVLVLGETGAGKEIIARAIHEWSGRTGELRAVDCGAVPETLFESTFFGHRRGAFTDAQQARTGEMVLAHQGTLFLDEVANMGAGSQAKFLRSLETGQVTPLGANAAQTVDVRVVAATNRDLMVDHQGFRLDLLNRLAGFVVRLPPLRARREDMGILGRHFLMDAGVTEARIRPAAARCLFGASFPGNLRQLRACLRSAATLAGREPIDVEHLSALAAEPATTAAVALVSDERREKPDANLIQAVLLEAGGNVVHAARALKTHPRQLYRWMERFDIDPTQYRRPEQT